MSLPAKQFRVGYGSSNYTLYWGDVPAAFSVNTRVSEGLFTLSIDLASLSAGSVVFIDPSIVSEGFHPQATAYAFQRKVFYEPNGGYYWLFYNEGPGQTRYRNSANGIDWSSAQSMPSGWPWPFCQFVALGGGAAPYCRLSVFNEGRKVVVTTGVRNGDTQQSPWTVSISLHYAVGTISGSSITWEPDPATGNPVRIADTLERVCDDSTSYCEATAQLRYVNLLESTSGDLAFAYNFFVKMDSKECSSSSYSESTLYVKYRGERFRIEGNSGCGQPDLQLRSILLHSEFLGRLRLVYQFPVGSSVELRERWIDSYPDNTGPMAAVADTYVDSGFGGTLDHGGEAGLFLRAPVNPGETTSDSDILLMFPKRDAWVNVKQATLNLRVKTPPAGSGTAWIDVYQPSSPWNEKNVTYNTKPGVVQGSTSWASSGIDLASLADRANLPLDVTNTVRGAYDGTWDDNGLLVTIRTFPLSNIWFYSKEYGSNGVFAPTLTVSYVCCVSFVEMSVPGVSDSGEFSAVTDANYGVHVVYRMQDGRVGYSHYNPSTKSWSRSTDIFSGPASYPAITVDYATNEMYAFAIRETSIVMKSKPSDKTWSDQSIVSPVTGRFNMTHLGSNFASISTTKSSWVSLVWSEHKSQLTQRVMFASLPIQTVWSPYALSKDPWDGNGLAPYGQYFANLGEHISPSTGMLTIRQTDLRVPGRGLDLEITRVYSEPYSFVDGRPFNYESYPWASLGNGWQLNFPWMTRATNASYIHLWDGQGYRIPSSFWTGPGGGFENHQGEHFRFVRNSTDIVLYPRSGVAYRFDPTTHALTRIIDTIGNNITLRYNSQSVISNITDTVGRIFVFHYYGNNLLRSINQTASCQSGVCSVRGVTYGYTGLSLTSFKDPAGRPTSYLYDGVSDPNVKLWLISRIIYPTGWFTSYTYTPLLISTQAYTYSVASQEVASSSATVRKNEFAYTRGPGDQVTGATVKTFNGTQTAPVGFTDYSFSFAGVTWNISDANHKLVRGTQQRFGIQGEIPRETIIVTDPSGNIGSYTNYYRYDLWGNLIYSRKSINPSANKYHESFNAYYNNGLPPGFYAFQETFSQGNFTLPDNQWSTYSGTWLVRDGAYNGTSPIFNPPKQDFFAWVNSTSPDISLVSSVYITKRMATQDQRVGLMAHYPGQGVRKWALVLHNSTSGEKLSLLDENVAWLVESPCTITYNTWYKFNFTISGKQAWGNVTAPGISCSVSGSFTSNDITTATGFGLYAGGYSALFDNIVVATVSPRITGTGFSNSFVQNGAPSMMINGALAGTAELQNGTGSPPIESYFSYYSWDGLKQSKQRYDSASLQWLNSSFTYDGYGNMITYVDPRGNTGYLSYSSKYNSAYLTNQTLLDGQTRITTLYGYYINTGLMSWARDPRLYNTTYQYDSLGRITRVTYPSGLGFVDYAYNDQLNYVNVTNTNGWKTHQAYDGLGMLSKVERFSQGVAYSAQTYTYDYSNRIIAQTDPLNRTHSFQYDALGRPVKLTSPDGNFTLTSYNDVESWVLLIGEDGVRRCSVYDRLGRLISVIENAPASPPCIAGFVTNYYYDNVGNLLETVNSKGQRTRHSYDNLNRLVRTEYPDGTLESFTYDNNANLVTKTDRKSVQTSYAYDSLDRLKTVTYTGGLREDYSYDANNNLSSLDSQNATLTFEYDPLNRVKTEIYRVNGGQGGGGGGGGGCRPACPDGPEPVSSQTTSTGGTPADYAFTYTYDGDALSTIRYPDLLTVKYGYDDLGRVANVTKYGTSTYYVKLITYLKNDQIEKITYGNEVTATYSYDKLSRPSTITVKNEQKTFLSLSYLYNLGGTIASIKGDTNGAMVDERYTYDAVGRVTNATVEGNNLISNIWYEYDSLGNRLRQGYKQGSATNWSITNYDYSQTATTLANNQLARTTGASAADYSYDELGNLKDRRVGSNVWNYTWDASNRLVKVSLNGNAPSVYAYDGLGRRVESVEGTTTTFYAYLGTETLYEQVAGGAQTDYLYAAGLRIAKITGTTINYYLTDHLGSTRLVTDSPPNPTKVNVLFSSNYQPFGQDNGSPTCSGTCEKHKFTGKPYSQATGLYYSFQRWYDPEIGRLISQDLVPGSISQPQTLNRYTYVANSPTNYVDPTGLWLETAFDIAMVLWDIDEFQRDPSLLNGLFLAADVAALLLPIPAVAGVLGRGGRITGKIISHGDDVAKVATRLDDAGDALRVTNRLENAVDASRAAQNAGRSGALSVQIGNSRVAETVFDLIRRGADPRYISVDEVIELGGRRLRPDTIVWQGPLRGIYEVKGGYASGTRLLAQASNYVDLGKLHKLPVNYILYGGGSENFLNFLLRLKVVV